jgi:hypothetical protein
VTRRKAPECTCRPGGPLGGEIGENAEINVGVVFGIFAIAVEMHQLSDAMSSTLGEYVARQSRPAKRRAARKQAS